MRGTNGVQALAVFVQYLVLHQLKKAAKKRPLDFVNFQILSELLPKDCPTLL